MRQKARARKPSWISWLRSVRMSRRRRLWSQAKVRSTTHRKDRLDVAWRDDALGQQRVNKLVPDGPISYEAPLAQLSHSHSGRQRLRDAGVHF
jgi:hypothetical protein